jgi:NADPH:quinone reductase-like Zn-dependent oxidoreductase
MDESHMKALRLTSTSGSKPSLSLSTLPKPSPPPGSVLVKIRAAGINPSDVINAKGGFPYTTFPRTPGRDYAGVVVEGPEEFLGKEIYGTSGKVLSFTTDGTHAEYCVISCDGINLKPSSLSFVQAAAVGVPFTTAALTVRRAMIQSTDRVLILGASGAVGSAACQLARNKACQVLRAARRGSVDVNLTTDPELSTVKSLTEGKGVDVVIDTTGSPALMRAALRVLAPRGRLVYISAPKEGSTDFTFDMKQLYREEKMIIGCNSLLQTLPEAAKELGGLTPGFEDGSLQAPNESDIETIRIEDAVNVYQTKGNSKKIVISF